MKCILALIALVFVLFALQGSFGKKSKAVKHDKKEEITDILTTEGEKGWLEKVLKKAKEKHQKKPSSKKRKTRKRLHDVSAPTETISGLESSLTQMETDTDENNRGWATRAKNGVIELKNNWDTTPPARRGAIVGAINTVAAKLDKFANAGRDPVGAIRGAIDIISSFANIAGPTGQIVSVVLNFISGFLSIFGKGPSPKPVSQVVREEIEKWYSRDLSNQANGAIFEFQQSKAFLNGVALSGNTLTDSESNALSANVPVYNGVAFMGTLASEIRDIITSNNVDQAKTCLKYIELYARLSVLKDMILQQLASLISHSNIRAGIYAVQHSLQTSARELFRFLYESDIGSNIIPYFDPDKYELTDAYMSEILEVDNYDRTMAGTYFISVRIAEENAFGRLGYYANARKIDDYRGLNLLNDQASEFDFHWKLVPHGNNLFSIVNRYGCPDDDLCDSLLTWTEGSVATFATIGNDDPAVPALWEITRERRRYRIRCKRGCSTDPPHEMCNAELSYMRPPFLNPLLPRARNIYYYATLATDGGKTWILRKINQKK